VSQAAATDTAAVAQVAVTAATKDAAAFGTVLASAQASALSSGSTGALATATVEAFVSAQGDQMKAVSTAFAQVRASQLEGFGV
jgi:hypothetical protein